MSFSDRKQIVIIGGGDNPSMVEKYRILNPDCEVLVMSRVEFDRLAKDRIMSGDTSLIAIQSQMHAMELHEMHEKMMKQINLCCADMQEVSRKEARDQKQQNRFRSQHHSRNFRRK